VSSIAAIITAPGQAAVSIIRVSGEDSWDIVTRFLPRASLKANHFKLSWFVLKDKDGDTVKLDQVLVLPFKAPRSYTGEDVIEIHSHGGSYIANKILDTILDAGARLAKPGEFTERAFLNHKIDLSQAESVMDIISARSSAMGANAIKLYQGQLGSKIRSLRETLLDLLASVTAGIDFPDEVGDYDANDFAESIDVALNTIDELLAGEEQGRILREGYKVALVGDPNVGKSSLLNTLVNDERAIVTDIAGTTRDVIEESISIKGLPVVLLDTAGIRDSDDLVEKIGIKKSFKAIEDADLVIDLYDLSCVVAAGAPAQAATNSPRYPSARKILRVGTKSDLAQGEGYDLCVSSKTGENIDKLKDMIYRSAMNSANSDLKINKRQADLLRQSKSSLELALQAARAQEAPDFWTIDLKAAIQALGEITGDVITEELLDNVFSKFCIGK